MTRPDFDVDAVTHGQMKQLAKVRDTSLPRMYLTATKLLIMLDPEADFSPDMDSLLRWYLARCEGRDSSSSASNSGQSLSE